MGSSQRTAYDALSIGFLLVAFAVAVLIAWVAAEWILVVPIFLLEAGGYYAILGFLTRPGEEGKRSTAGNSVYYIFWGSTMALLGLMWLFNRQYPGNLPLLFAVFIIWIGLVVFALSLPRMRQSRV